ncbi:bifunctional glutathionylspermidine amidase/glutathionylspermidine synthase [Actinobacillus succinogenes]|uniref:Glutathionylspermidine amidase n=1 Tax=Actinobacillus succinogenes (strain ATCC 55618 / DSM 22257 / CCUG 43843 / 130Z) TaxID=339671 RepID=A6VMH7_ACTSZ|nr:bifunctional glutathionylspermidine amidase/synthase [Actinobacillus succinogenes]ABR74174.1 Glutathionylspermidine amidase [Actinobacillus succinogenes 130Z]PHI39396.1 bifunctional glutathionylspermidine amidase/glutathionylspermidine synthase [Actinobacillus succinogenes]
MPDISPNIPTHDPFGSLLGYAPGGIAIYSSDYETADKQEYPDDAAFRSYVGREYMGYKWQCVEFARRYLYLNHGWVFTDVGMAYEIFALRFLRQVVNDAILPLQAFANGSQKKPEAGALLIWQDGGEFKHTGHVAIITEVLDNKIRIAEQNVLHSRLPSGQQWTRELPMTVDENGYLLHDTFDDTEILGWMIQTDDTSFSIPQPMPERDLLEIKANHIENHGQFDGKWLNENNDFEKAFATAMQGHCVSRTDQYRYFTISESAHQELIRATNELHLMYLHATDKVLKDDNLLKLFNIPKLLWPRLRLSWQNRRYQTISGRLDFCMDKNGLKVYEYNADSASCHAEAGDILNRWAVQAGLTAGKNPGADLRDVLADCWKHSQATPLVHIMQDNDLEEDYHALFMQKSLTQAGFATQIMHGTEGLHWDIRGNLLDDDDNQVRTVWKTWAWETVLEQLRADAGDSEVAPPIRTGYPEDKVRLIDVLLRPEVLVYEPLWTAIPSNKAILPVLWSLFPYHRYLLEADFELTDGLRKCGYARKPIGGRRGDNVQLIGENGEISDRTFGKFEAQTNIYQRLWCLPKAEEQYIQICTFTVGGHYGGSCLRSDPTRVIVGGSDMQPLRVISDKDFLK